MAKRKQVQTPLIGFTDPRDVPDPNLARLESVLKRQAVRNHRAGMTAFHVSIEVIESTEARYADPGDWIIRIRDGVPYITVRVVNQGTLAENMRLAVHESFEAMLCFARGVEASEVDRWDFAGGNGDQSGAPYYLEHQLATVAEQAFATADGGPAWEDYDKHIDRTVAKITRRMKEEHASAIDRSGPGTSDNRGGEATKANQGDDGR